MSDILEALNTLDKDDDENWTADGAPRVDVVSALVGRELKRQEIVDAAPEFNRANISDVPENAPESEPETPTYESVLDLPIPQVCRDLNLIASARAELQAQQLDLAASMAAAKREQKQISAKLQLLDRAQSRLPQKRTVLSAELQGYIAQQNKNRSERAARTLAFIKEGVSPQQVKAAMEVKAPIDAAMARKNTRGTQRPGASVQ